MGLMLEMRNGRPPRVPNIVFLSVSKVLTKNKNSMLQKTVPLVRWVSVKFTNIGFSLINVFRVELGDRGLRCWCIPGLLLVSSSQTGYCYDKLKKQASMMKIFRWVSKVILDTSALARPQWEYWHPGHQILREPPHRTYFLGNRKIFWTPVDLRY